MRICLQITASSFDQTHHLLSAMAGTIWNLPLPVLPVMSSSLVSGSAGFGNRVRVALHSPWNWRICSSDLWSSIEELQQLPHTSGAIIAWVFGDLGSTWLCCRIGQAWQPVSSRQLTYIVDHWCIWAWMSLACLHVQIATTHGYLPELE